MRGGGEGKERWIRRLLRRGSRRIARSKEGGEREGEGGIRW